MKSDNVHLPGDFYIASVDGKTLIRLTNSIIYDTETGDIPKESASNFYPDNSGNPNNDMAWIR